MFYAAAILILLGVLIFIYSISIETPSSFHNPAKAKGLQPDNTRKTANIRPFEETERSRPQPELRAHQPGPQQESQAVYIERVNRKTVDDIPHHMQPTWRASRNNTPAAAPRRQAETSSESFSAEKEQSLKNDAAAAMYEDDSGNVDYSVPASEIDPSLQAYKKIKRIGEGNISSGQNGINFYIEKKLYRFDFHRIGEFNHGPNYIAFRIADQPVVKLFIFKTGAKEAENIVNDYKLFKGDSV